MEIEPVRQDELNHDREKVNTFDHIFKHIINFRGVFSFTVIFNDSVYKSNISMEKAEAMCKKWSPILNKTNRELKDIDYEDDLISVQVSTLNHELVIVEGLIMREESKRYRLMVQQYTLSSLVPLARKSLVKGRLSQLLKEKEYTGYQKIKEQESEEPKKTQDEREHPVEKEVLRRREKIGEVRPDTCIRERRVLERMLAALVPSGPPHRQQYSSYRGSRGTKIEWPSSVDRALLEATEEGNKFGWLPQKAEDELEQLSVSSSVKRKYRHALKISKYGGALKVLRLSGKQKKLREQRKMVQKLSLTKTQF